MKVEITYNEKKEIIKLIIICGDQKLKLKGKEAKDAYNTLEGAFRKERDYYPLYPTYPVYPTYPYYEPTIIWADSTTGTETTWIYNNVESNDSCIKNFTVDRDTKTDTGCSVS